MSILGSYIKYLGEKAGEEIENRVGQLLPSGQDLVYLDCGCDDGVKTIKRANIISTKRIFGIENQPGRAILSKKSGVNVKVVDLNKKWPFKDESIDCITATEVVEHLINLDNFFNETRRILKRGGKIIISTDNLAGYHNIFALLIGNQPYTGPYLSRIFPIGHRPHAKYYKDSRMDPHINVMTAKALNELLLAYGFKILNFSGVGFYPIFPLLARIFANIDKYHASYAVILAEK